jgi:hypothetical protein
MKKVILALAMSSLTMMAQSVISAKAGLIHYLEGDATLNDQSVVMKESKFPDMKNKDVLRTTEGRAEVLLAPGTILRLGENSAIRMESNSITATRLELLSGTAIVEVMEVAKLSSLEFAMGTDTVSIRKAGLYRLEMDPVMVKVYQGELVTVNANNDLKKITDGRSLTLSGEQVIGRFDKKQNMDELVQWADRRSGTLALANVHSAQSVANSIGSGGRLGASGWFFDPYYNMMTYVPFGRGAMSPFGYGFYSPITVFAVYNPPVFTNPTNGFGGGQGGFDGGAIMNSAATRASNSSFGGGYSGGGVGGGGSAAASAPVSGGERASGSAGAGGGGRASGAGGGGGGGGSH